ncbi:3-hydroxyacyl-CoA dehydrogenase [Tirmania nivea]|nr:3-hydroxyacyl-CoA dehydrogenase [Tirmania nivea]KAF8430055.1 3-hydroxyacyl-CoA dehydrogenase [Tirmania nivea]
MLPQTLHRVFCNVAVKSRGFSTVQAYNVKKLGVVGAGQMGLGIALVASKVAQVPVTLVDASEAAIDKSRSFMESLLARDIEKQRITEADAKQIKERITTTTELGDLCESDFVIEAVPEIPSLKFNIFSKLAKLCPSDAILATNTSSISITKIAASAEGAEDRVLSTHFMNPVPVQKGVEIITGLQTSEVTLERALEFMKAMGKISSTSKDSPGFLANRILMPYINEAIICLETGIGTKEDIDNIMKNGTNVPMGPLTLADFIGLDTCYAIMKVLHEDTGDSKYRPAVLLGKMVDAGWLGKKSGRGFYNYAQKQ